jgi:hypothetical protein
MTVAECGIAPIKNAGLKIAEEGNNGFKDKYLMNISSAGDKT